MPRGLAGVALLLISVPLVAHADALDDLRAKLAQFDSLSPVRGELTMRSTDRALDDKEAKPAESKATAHIFAGPDGLGLRWDPTHLAAARMIPAGTSTPPAGNVRRAMDSLTLHAVNDSLNAAHAILRKLEKATLLEERTETVDGQPQRVVVLRFDKPSDKQASKYLKDFDASGRVWLDADGVPVRAESTVKAKVRAFVVIGMEADERETYRFSRIGSRLVMLHYTKHSKNTGAGEDRERTLETTLVLSDPAAAATALAKAAGELPTEAPATR